MKLTEDVKKLIQQHCEIIPHHKSHYSLKKTQLNYFNDSSITLHTLYISFINYYAAVIGDFDIPIDEKTFFKYFNRQEIFRSEHLEQMCVVYVTHTRKASIIKKSMMNTNHS